MGDGEPAERPCEVEVVSRKLPFPRPLRAGRAARCASGPPSGRALRLGDARRRRRSRRCWHDAHSSRSSTPTRPTSARGATASSAGSSSEFQAASSRPIRAAQGAPNATLRRRARSSSRARYLAEIARELGARRTADPRADEPGAAAARRCEPEQLRAGHVRLRRPADEAEGLCRRRSRRSRSCREARLVVVGDGPERCAAAGGVAASPATAERIEFRGALSRDEALRVVAGADGGAALERLGEPAALRGRGALGRRARRRRRPSAACPEVVRDGENGLLVPPGPRRTSSRLRSAGSLGRSRGSATASPRRRSRRWRRSRARRSTAGSRRSSRRRPDERDAARALRRAHALPRCRCRPGWRKKWDAVEEQLDYRVVGAASADSAPSDERFRLTPPVPAARARRFPLLPAAARSASASDIRDFDPDAIFASDPVVGAASLLGRTLAGRRSRVIVEVHGDWRTFTRAYGSPLAPADRASRRRAAERAVSTPTRPVPSRRSRQVWSRTSGASRRPRSSPRSATSRRSPSARRRRCRSGRPSSSSARSSRTRTSRGSANAWRIVAASRPGGAARDRRQRLAAARRRAAGRDFPDRVEHHAWLEPGRGRGRARRRDRARAPVLARGARPGDHRVVRARPCGRRDRRRRDPRPRHARGRGPPRAPADTETLADALERVLGDRELAEQMGAAARARYADWDATPEELAREHLRALVRRCRHRALSAAPLRHPDARRRPSGARADGRPRARARRPLRDELVVLCEAVGPHDLPPNVRVCVFGAGTRLGRGVRFARGCAARAAAEATADAVLVHMVPLFVAARGAAREAAARVPMLLWYTHWNAEPARCASRCRSSTSSSASAAARSRFDPPKLFGDRPRDRRRAVRPVGARRGRTARCSCSRSAARRAGRATTRCSRRSRSPPVAAATRGSRSAARS